MPTEDAVIIQNHWNEFISVLPRGMMQDSRLSLLFRLTFFAGYGASIHDIISIDDSGLTSEELFNLITTELTLFSVLLEEPINHSHMN